MCCCCLLIVVLKLYRNITNLSVFVQVLSGIDLGCQLSLH